jgi:hypothetical protein
MRTAEDILEEYRRGNFYERLTWYLEHRDLRPQFMEIDLDTPALPQAAVPEKKASRIRVAVDSIRYRLARCCST